MGATLARNVGGLEHGSGRRSPAYRPASERSDFVASLGTFAVTWTGIRTKMKTSIHGSFSAVRRWLFTLVFATTILVVPRLARAAVFPCTEAGLTSALAAGGLATFSCAAPTTIVVSATRNMATGTELDGGGRLIISGGDVRVPLNVAAGVTAQIRNVVIERGRTDAYGGCLAVSGNLTVTDSTIRSCYAGIGGSGAWVGGGGQLRIDRSTLSGNSGGVEGVIATHGTLTLTNTTISDNTSNRGVVARYGGTATLNHCTVVGSTSEALFAVLPGDALTVSHSILVSGSGGSVGGTGSFISQGYNMLSAAGITPTGDTTGNQIGVTPNLGPLANNGGPTQTRALLACSPGINAGAASGGPATDQRGSPRLSNGARDIGAFESAQNTCVSIENGSRNEGNAGTTAVLLTVRLSGATTLATRVGWATADGTATVADGDYVAASGTLTFPARSTASTITFYASGDTRFEPNETVTVALRAPSGLTLGDAQAVATIINDDPLPSLSVADVRMAEGDAGARAMTFTVSLSAASSQTVTVGYATANGTATVLNGDYVATSGTLTFPPGAVSRTVTVSITGDTRFEPDETFTLSLANPTNATLGDSTATGTIANDDDVPVISIADVSVAEGNAGTTNAVFTVTISNASSTAASVDWATANGTALAGSDYTAANGRLTFPPGTTSQTVMVAISGDTTHEPDETFRVVLSAPAGAAIGDGTATGTITNDDAVPAVSIADARVTEGNAGTSSLAFDVTLSNPRSTAVTVPYATADGSATLDDDDYEAGSGVVTFAPGVTRQTVTVTVHGDARFEADEALVVTLGAPSGATIADGSATGTIQNDDAMPALSIGDVTVAEGNAGSIDAVFTVSLDTPSGAPVTVSYATANGTATAGSDYTANAGTLTFAPGVVSQTITVAVSGDAVFEGDEAYRVELSAPVGATIADGSGTGTITDDEEMPGLSIGSVTVAEGNASAKAVTLTVTLSGASGQAVKVDWTTVDGTATVASRDYASGMGTLTFAPGVTSQTLQVMVTGDALVEPDETLLVRLSNASGANIATAEGTVTVTNDDTSASAPDGGTAADASSDAPPAPEPPPAPEADDSVAASSDGCGCKVLPQSDNGGAPGALLALALAVTVGRRRRAL